VIVDPSAVIAILLAEPQRAALVEVVARADMIAMSAAGVVELAAVVDGRRDPDGHLEP
jgi:uncharacterized protein with PIN domain